MFRMAGIQRIIKSGIRLYNNKPRGLNFTASPINRLGTSANSYRSLSSSSSGDGRSILSNVKRSYNVDTFAMVNALKAEGVPVQHAKAIADSMAQVLAELKVPSNPSTLLKCKFERLRENIKFDEFTPLTAATIRLDQRIDQEIEALREKLKHLWMGLGVGGAFLFSVLIGMVCLIGVFETHPQASEEAQIKKR